jgi:Ca2+-binding RTX toxin-like protein
MPSFLISGTSQTAQLLSAGQAGVVAEAATLFVNASAAVVMDGSSQLAVLGNVTSQAQEAVRIQSATVEASISVGRNGSIIGLLEAGIRGSVADKFNLNNAGVIMGLEEAVEVTALPPAGVVADFHITNTGLIQSNGESSSERTMEFVTPTGGNVYIANSGTMVNGGFVGVLTVSGARLDLSNSGIIQCRIAANAITAGVGDDRIDNTGTIMGVISLFDGNDVIRNSGTIDGFVMLGNGNDRVTNTGTLIAGISMSDTATSGNIDDLVINGGLIVGDVTLGNGNDTFRSRGGTVEGVVSGGAGDDTYFVDDAALVIEDSSGFDVVHASADYALAAGIEELRLRGPVGLSGIGSADANGLFGGGGGDTLRGQGGDDTLAGGDGDDRLFGGEGNDRLTAQRDDDVLRGGVGDDRLLIASGDATLDGGLGTDILSLELLTGDGIVVDLLAGTGGHAQVGTWSLRGIETVEGGVGDDIITGDAAANLIAGNGGADRLAGGNGNDTLIGGAGADTMNSGGGNDVFQFLLLADSAAGSPDLIEGFIRSRDKIDLSALDGGDGFVFLGTQAFGGGATGEVRYTIDAGTGLTHVEVRLAGSVANDMVLELAGAITLTADNFIL